MEEVLASIAMRRRTRLRLCHGLQPPFSLLLPRFHTLLLTYPFPPSTSCILWRNHPLLPVLMSATLPSLSCHAHLVFFSLRSLHDLNLVQSQLLPPQIFGLVVSAIACVQMSSQRLHCLFLKLYSPLHVIWLDDINELFHILLTC